MHADSDAAALTMVVVLLRQSDKLMMSIVSCTMLAALFKPAQCKRQLTHPTQMTNYRRHRAAHACSQRGSCLGDGHCASEAVGQAEDVNRLLYDVGGPVQASTVQETTDTFKSVSELQDT